MKRRLFPLILLFCSLLWAEDHISDVLTAESIVLMDFHTGRLLYERDGERPIPPASMTKVMTLYLAYDAIREGILEKDQLITINEVGSSFSRPPRSSLMLLEEGQELTLLELMQGLAVASGNDAAYALADLIGPGVDAFVARMNRKAAALGLRETVFVDPDGWSEENLVTAEEYALLARSYIRDYPEALEELHSIPFFYYPLPEHLPAGREFRIQAPRKKKNTNILLGIYEGMDGLKTGYIDESGFNFTSTAVREECRLIAVIMGIHTDSYIQGLRTRARESVALLDYGFDRYSPRELAAPELPELRVWMGREKTLVPQVTDNPEALLAEEEIPAVYSLVSLPEQLHAPLTADQVIGSVGYYIGGDLLEEFPITAGEDIPEGNLFQRLRDKALLSWREFRSQP